MESLSIRPARRCQVVTGTVSHVELQNPVRYARSMSKFVLRDLREAAERLWPAETAEPWDRVGLIVGADEAPIRRVLLAVDAVRATAEEAVQNESDVLLTHHPLLLRGVHTVAEDTAKGAVVTTLIRGGCALLAAHTNADAPRQGVSDTLALKLGLQDVRPIVPADDPSSGIGRVGSLPEPMRLREFAERIAQLIPRTVGGVRVAGASDQLIQRVALCGGAGDSLLQHPEVIGAEVYVTSDLRHHPAQEALEQAATTSGPALIDISHWAAESLWLESAAAQLGAVLPGVEFLVSELNTDPWSFAVGCHS